MTLTINYEFREKFQRLNFSLNYCYQCATCSGGCPVAFLTQGSYNPRKIIEAALLGLEEKLIQQQEPNVWLCVTCQKCVELCPQGVALTEIFDHLKNYCVETGNIPTPYKDQATMILESGMAIPFSDAILKRRETLGLPQLKTAATSEIKTLMKETKFDKKIQYEWKSPEKGDA
jgi:heterodisulfide reductase subunit C